MNVLTKHLLSLQLVGSLLISVAVYARAASIVTLPIVSGILACGVILLMTSLLGLAGAMRHHQVMLFFVSFFVNESKITAFHPEYHEKH